MPKKPAKKSMEELLGELNESFGHIVRIPSWVDEEKDNEQLAFWKSLQEPTVEDLSYKLGPKEFMPKKEYIRHLEAEVENLKTELTKSREETYMERCRYVETFAYKSKQKLAEAEKKEGSKEESVEEDRRVAFGQEITFKTSSPSPHELAFIGTSLAKRGDEHKVLIPRSGYTFKIREDYFEGKPALEIHWV